MFGEVRKSDTELCQKFNVNVFPSMLILTDPYEYGTEPFTGEFKIDLLNKFLNKYSYSAPKYEKKAEVH